LSEEFFYVKDYKIVTVSKFEDKSDKYQVVGICLEHIT